MRTGSQSSPVSVGSFSLLPSPPPPLTTRDDYTKLNAVQHPCRECVYISARCSLSLVVCQFECWKVVSSGGGLVCFSRLYPTPLPPLRKTQPALLAFCYSGLLRCVCVEKREFLLAICVQITLLFAVCCFPFACPRMCGMRVFYLYTPTHLPMGHLPLICHPPNFRHSVGVFGKCIPKSNSMATQKFCYLGFKCIWQIHLGGLHSSFLVQIKFQALLAIDVLRT